ncbi:MAG: hypothetical protein ACP5IA_04265 [Sediminispirochaetaceae bacterium]
MTKVKDLWYGLSIRTKLMTFFSILIVIISVLNVYILTNIYRYTDIYTRELEKTFQVHILEKKSLNAEISSKHGLSAAVPRRLSVITG